MRGPAKGGISQAGNSIRPSFLSTAAPPASLHPTVMTVRRITAMEATPRSCSYATAGRREFIQGASVTVPVTTNSQIMLQ